MKLSWNTAFKALIFAIISAQFFPQFFQTIKNAYEEHLTGSINIGVIKISGAVKDSLPYRKQIQTLLTDQSIQGLLLLIDSPGGASGASQALFMEIERARTKHQKPVVAYVQGLCASGAYYVAAACDCIITSPSALIGSIGVYLGRPYIKEILEYHKIEYKITSSGEYKLIGSPFIKHTPQQERALQELSDSTYQQFIHDIAKARSLKLDEHGIWANGRVFIGSRALELNLVDSLGSMSDVENHFRKVLVVNPETKIKWKAAPKESFFNTFLGIQDPLSDTEQSFVGELCSQAVVGISQGIDSITTQVQA